MTVARRNPRILIVTPEVTYLFDNMGNIANYPKAKAGGMADVSAALVSALFDQGADVHTALPNYRPLIKEDTLVLETARSLLLMHHWNEIQNC